MARLIPLFSGSSGNCYYIGSKKSGILIDAGRSAKQIKEKLAAFDIDPSCVKGIFVTHEHIDHVKGLRVFASKFKLPVFASEKTILALRDMEIHDGSFQIHSVENKIEVAGITVKNFKISHDCADGRGYKIYTEDERVLSFATDLGFVSDEVFENLCGCDFAVIESNHDVNMLLNGPYPYMLKRRILSERGHLSNETTAGLLPELVKKGTRRFMLAHLSSENNTKELSFETSLCSLKMAGFEENKDFTLNVSPKENINLESVIF